MDNLYWLEQIQPSDHAFVGDKALLLSRVAQHGHPVLPSCVVSAGVFWEFLQILQGAESLVADLPHSCLHLDVDNPRHLQKVAQQLRQGIINAQLPSSWIDKIAQVSEHYATSTLIFRPSLMIASNQHADLNIAELLEAQVCICNQEAIALALKQTWSQLFRARSLLYWQKAGLELRQINLAVLVQPLMNAVASGYLIHKPTSIEIQASWGLSMAIAQGEVIPDSYFIQPDGIVRSQQLGNKSLVYGLGNHPIPPGFKPTILLPQSSASYLQTYTPEEAQKKYALEDNYLQNLIQLAQQLRTQLGTNFSIEWTLAQSADAAPQLYLTQVSNSSSLIASDVKLPIATTTGAKQSSQDHLRKNATHQFLTHGLAAAGGRVIAPAYVTNQKPESITPGVVLVAPAIAPDWLPLLQQSVGFITEQGGLTSHSAILARELSIPAIVSAANATKLIQTGELLLVDGDQGEIYCLGQGYQTASAPLTSSTPAARPPIATQLLLNLSQSSLLERVRDLPVQGIGLLRSELMVLNVLERQQPNTWFSGRKTQLMELWQAQISKFAHAFAPRPVFYRSLDWRSHEFQLLSQGLLNSGGTRHTAENNLLLNQGGTGYLANPQLFDLELAVFAAVQRAGYTNLHLLLPFVRTVEEFTFYRRRVEQAGLTQIAQFQLWIMAEVPSVLFLLPEYVKAGAQGVSIGTNDLTQLLLGIDRDQGQLAATLDSHPVVMQAIAQIIQMARQANIPCSICGQAPALYPELIDSLVRWGITSISVEPEAVERTHVAIACAEQRLILAASRTQLDETG